MEEDSTEIYHENLLMHFQVMGPGHCCPLTSGQERLMEKVTQLTKFGNPPSSLEATLHPHWRPSSRVSVPRLMLPAQWPGGPGIARLLDNFPVLSPPLASVLASFSIKRQHATQQAPVNTAIGTMVAKTNVPHPVSACRGLFL